MPDRSQPGSGWFGLAYLLASAIGVVGLILEPSISVRELLESAHLEWAVVVWSVGFLAAGFLAGLARHRGWYYAEVRAVYGLAGLFALWAVMVGIAATGSSAQAGLGFACTAAFFVGWARYRMYRLRRNLVSQAALRRAVGDSLREGRA